MLQTFLIGVAFAAAGAAIYVGAWYAQRLLLERGAVARERERLTEDVRRAKEEASEAKRLAVEEAKALIQQARERLLEDIRQRRDKIHAREKSLEKAERDLRLRQHHVTDRDTALAAREAEIKKKEALLTAKESALQAENERCRALLARAAGMHPRDAKDELLKAMRDEASAEAEVLHKAWEREVRARADRHAREIIAAAILKAVPQEIAFHATTVVPISRDEVKGRIIGREGRNIRLFETLTGVDVLVDATPHAIVLSCYHPLRREIARRAMEQLVEDNRIHAARIENAVKEAREQVEEGLEEEGAELAREADVENLHPMLLRLLGMSRYRMERGYNLYEHARAEVRVAHAMAREIGADAALTRRIALLSNAAKAWEAPTDESSLAERAEKLLREHGEHERVCRGVSNVLARIAPAEGVEEALVMAAHEIHANRPGEVDEAFAEFTSRLHAMEATARSLAGVGVEVFAVKAGREIRIIVDPRRLSDIHLPVLADAVAKALKEKFPEATPLSVSALRQSRASFVAE